MCKRGFRLGDELAVCLTVLHTIKVRRLPVVAETV